MRYQIISAQRLNQLEAMVNNELRHDWTPTGGLIVYRCDTADDGSPELVFAQAMTKNEPQQPA